MAMVNSAEISKTNNSDRMILRARSTRKLVKTEKLTKNDAYFGYTMRGYEFA
jgi:hypothetical protein